MHKLSEVFIASGRKFSLGRNTNSSEKLLPQQCLTGSFKFLICINKIYYHLNTHRLHFKCKESIDVFFLFKNHAYFEEIHQSS